MPTIKLLRSVAGRNFEGKPFSFAKGVVLEVSERLAKDLTQSDNAELIKATKRSQKRQTATDKRKKETR